MRFGKGSCDTLVWFTVWFGPPEYANNIQIATKVALYNSTANHVKNQTAVVWTEPETISLSQTTEQKGRTPLGLNQAAKLAINTHFLNVYSYTYFRIDVLLKMMARTACALYTQFWFQTNDWAYSPFCSLENIGTEEQRQYKKKNNICQLLKMHIHIFFLLFLQYTCGIVVLLQWYYRYHSALLHDDSQMHRLYQEENIPGLKCKSWRTEKWSVLNGGCIPAITFQVQLGPDWVRLSSFLGQHNRALYFSLWRTLAYIQSVPICSKQTDVSLPSSGSDGSRV